MLQERADTRLSSSTTVSRYRRLEKEMNRDEIVNFIRERFTERYIDPLRSDTKHGFCTMAISCLMIEAIESFWRGWSDSRGKSELAFCSFFARSNQFIAFRPIAQEFYKHIRCGILHQAETTGGWRIRRTGVLFNQTDKTINATQFHNKLEKCLDEYCQALRTASWDEEVWKNLRKKMNAICKNC